MITDEMKSPWVAQADLCSLSLWGLSGSFPVYRTSKLQSQRLRIGIFRFFESHKNISSQFVFEFILINQARRVRGSWAESVARKFKSISLCDKVENFPAITSEMEVITFVLNI